MNRNSQNLQHHLLARESNFYPGRRHPIPSSFLFHERNFYKSITPRLTVQDVKMPLGSILKFSPNGKYLLMLCEDRISVDVYQYLGVGNAGDLLSKEKKECIADSDSTTSSIRIREELFSNLFRLQYNMPVVDLTYGRQVLQKDFRIFLDEGNFVLLASSGCVCSPSIRTFAICIRLCNIIFYLIDLKDGRITDTIMMEDDYVVLSDNHSVSFCDPTMAILSKHHQRIDLYIFNSASGRLNRLHTYERIFVIKMQLFDSNNLLMIFGKEQSHLLSYDRNNNTRTYVFYSISSEEILCVFYDDSLDLLNIVRNYCHHFRNSHSLFVPWNSTSPSTNEILRFDFDLEVAVNPGGMAEAAKQLTSSLPISSQSYSTSPYLDYSLFDYDEFYISSLERPKLKSKTPLRFEDRETGLLKFRVFLKQDFENAATDSDESVTYIFHPYEPFFISLQKCYPYAIANFHLYSANSVPSI